MKIILLGEDAVRLVPDEGPMTIEALSAEQQYSPFHMLGSSLALCTFSLLHSWADTVKLSGDDLAIEVRWTFAEEPHRVGGIAMTLDWPSLPAARTATAERVARLCPIHATLHHPPEVAIARTGGSAAAPVMGAVPVAAEAR